VSERVVWTDVAPRDGLQSWKREPVTTEVKVRLVRGLLGAGMPRVEATSFVSPKWVPQMADAREVLAGLADVLPRLRVLVPNLRGLELALESGVRGVLVTVGATDAFNRANVNRDVRESLTDVAAIATAARAAGCSVDVALSVCFGCPYEGDVDPGRVVDIVREVAALDIAEIGVADTIGVATPAAVSRMVALLRPVVAVERLSLHMHDTRGLGVANVLAGHAAGVRRFDGSAGGVGGCPFAPRSTGNVCSEDALSALAAAGATTEVDLEALCAVSARLAADLAAELPGKLYRAGIWAGQPVGEDSQA
jgi:hydroxymethylglutaryl-CoA lyase